MANPFDVAELDEIESDESKPSAEAASNPFDVPELGDAPAISENPTIGTGNRHLDALLKWYSGASEAATANHAGEIGRLGTKVGTALADMLQPSRTRDGMEPTYEGERGANAQEIVDRSMESMPGKAGYVAGIGVPALASGGAAGATVPMRMAAGGVQGGAAAHGEGQRDPLSLLLASGTGAGLAGLGGALASKAAAPATLGGVATTGGSRASVLLQGLADEAKKLGGQTLAGAGLGAVVSGMDDPGKALSGAAKGAAGAAALRYAGGLLPKAAPFVPGALAAAGQAAAPVGGVLAGRTSKASAQADVAYGTAPTMAWAVQTVLSSGDTGLEPSDEQQLTEALLSGDEDRVIAANFSLQQRSPAYGARLRRELESLQEE